MKVRELMQLTRPNLPGTTRSVTADQTGRTTVPVEMPNQIIARQEPSGSRDIFAVADTNDGVTGELPPALNLSRIRVPSTPHRRDLEFIKTQIALLPTPN
jgi:hypothetical protein